MLKRLPLEDDLQFLRELFILKLQENHLNISLNAIVETPKEASAEKMDNTTSSIDSKPKLR